MQGCALPSRSGLSLESPDRTTPRLRPAEIEDKVRISYRFAGVEEGQPYTVEQQVYCVVRDEKIERADLLCSGFTPHLPR